MCKDYYDRLGRLTTTEGIILGSILGALVVFFGCVYAANRCNKKEEKTSGSNNLRFSSARPDNASLDEKRSGNNNPSFFSPRASQPTDTSAIAMRSLATGSSAVTVDVDRVPTLFAASATRSSVRTDDDPAPSSYVTNSGSLFSSNHHHNSGINVGWGSSNNHDSGHCNDSSGGVSVGW